MATVVLLKGNSVQQTKHLMFNSQLQKWMGVQGHDLKEVSIYDYNHEILHAEMIILAIPVEQEAYQAFKEFLQSLPEGSLAGKKVCSFVLGGTLAHVSIMELYLQPLLTRLGVSDMIKPISTQSNTKPNRKISAINMDKLYEFFSLNIPQTI